MIRIALEILNSGRLGLAVASARGARRSMPECVVESAIASIGPESD